jgi:hypothetical protein
LDTADTGSSFNGGDHDVTLISPVWSPGVSDDVVRLSVLVSISDSGDGVIQLGSASSRVKNTTGVTLESHLVGFDGNRDWSLGDGSEELAGRVGLDGVDLGDVNSWSSSLLARSRVSRSGGVWVFSLGGLSVGSNVFHTLGLPSSSASIAGGVARDELLFGETEKTSTLLNLLSRFHGGGGRESPA